MKFISTSVLVAVIGTSLATFAQHGGAAIPACQAPFAACQAAGFKVGAHHKGDKEGADSGLWVDCIGAVADGKKQVPGVDPAAAQSCRAAHKAMKGK